MHMHGDGYGDGYGDVDGGYGWDVEIWIYFIYTYMKWIWMGDMGDMGDVGDMGDMEIGRAHV